MTAAEGRESRLSARANAAGGTGREFEARARAVWLGLRSVSQCSERGSRELLQEQGALYMKADRRGKQDQAMYHSTVLCTVGRWVPKIEVVAAPTQGNNVCEIRTRTRTQSIPS